LIFFDFFDFFSHLSLLGPLMGTSISDGQDGRAITRTNGLFFCPNEGFLLIAKAKVELKTTVLCRLSKRASCLNSSTLKSSMVKFLFLEAKL
jgi:hypothetical protein